MKRLATMLALVALTVGLTASGAFAYSIDFVGGYQFSDRNTAGFAETLNLDYAFGGKVLIAVFHPAPDAVFDANSYAVFAPFTLNPGAFVPGVSYDFTSNPYSHGFKLYNSANRRLLESDITLTPLVVTGSVGSINASLALNLTNITKFVSGSPILDAFGTPGPDALNLTLNFSSVVGAMIESAAGGTGIFSGSAIAFAVPEPTTLLLVGIGLVGLSVIGRKRIQR